MAKRRVEISIPEEFRNRLPRPWLRKAVLQTLDAALPNQPCQMSLAFCDDATIQRLNREYRGVNQVTDVLAFSGQHPGPWQGEAETSTERQSNADPFVSPPEEPPHLGEVIISYPQAQRQAAEAGHGVERETALLVVHGVLHLLGYDHQEPKDKALMWGLQDKVLTRLFPEGAAHPSTGSG